MAGTVARIATIAVAPAPDARAEGVDLTALVAETCQGVEGIDATTFRSHLNPEDIEDIEGGDITLMTLRAYAQSFAKGIRAGRICLEAADLSVGLLPEDSRPVVDRRVPVVAPDDDPVSGMDEAFVNCLLRTKYKHWKYEDQVRVFIDLDERTVETGLYFYPFSVDILFAPGILGRSASFRKEQCVRWRRASMKELT